jgi:hypothetical protein
VSALYKLISCRRGNYTRPHRRCLHTPFETFRNTDSPGPINANEPHCSSSFLCKHSSEDGVLMAK